MKSKKKFWIKKKKMGIGMAMVYSWQKENTVLARVEGLFEK